MTFYAPPVVGSIWRERRRQYRDRTVRVVEYDEAFAYIKTLTDNDGKPVKPRKPTRVRLSLWNRYWEPAK